MKKKVDLSDHQSLIHLETGDILQISLPENGTTGYIWHLEGPVASGASIDDDVVKKDSTAMGAGGTRKIKWLFVKAGTYHLHYELKQAWNPSEIEQNFEITVEVI